MQKFSENKWPLFFVRFTTGLATFVKQELAGIGVVDFLREDQRTLLFAFDENVNLLLQLKSVDDVFVFCGKFYDIKHTRDALAVISKQAEDLKLLDASKYCYKIRSISEKPSFKITVTLLGKRNYNRFEVEELICKSIVEKVSWQFVKNEPGAINPDFDLRILMEGENVMAGIRLAKLPLHRRSWKQENRQGSLKPPVAWAMAKAAKIEKHHSILDPMCGAGTILVEAALAFSPASISGVDRNLEALNCAKSNAKNAGVQIHFQQGNTLEKCIFLEHAFDRILCNLPWGKQIKVKDAIPQLYAKALLEFHRLIKPDGCIVLFTDQTDALENALGQTKTGIVLERFPVRLFGAAPCLFVLRPF